MKKPILFLLAAFILIVANAQKAEGLYINSKAPEFKLKDQNGNEVNLRDLRKKGQTVLLFYRGYWCPFCNRELKAFTDSLSLIQAKGAQVVAITAEMRESIDSTIKKTGATFPILYDEGMKTAANYQVAFTVDDRTAERYKMGGIDLLKINGQKEPMLPIPAVYIINKEGSISYRFFDENYRHRVSVKEILQNLK